MNRAAVSTLAIAAVLATACAPFPRLEARLTAPPALAAAQPAPTSAPLQTRVEVVPSAGATLQREAAPRLPAPTAEQIAALLPDREVDLAAPPQPLPQFIDTMFGQILQAPYFLGPGVAERRDIVSLRAAPRMNARAVFGLVRTALAQYGLDVGIEDGAIRIVESTALAQGAPFFIRSMSAPETPDGSRTVVQFVELRALEVGALMALLDETYPNREGVTFTPQAENNTLLITGNARDVASAAAVVSAIDQPRFGDGKIARIEPAFWPADRFAEALIQVMTAEGYKVGQAGDETPRALVVMPVPFGSQLLLLANDPATFERALHWVGELDRPSSTGGQEGVFVYTARNTSATDLAALVSRVSTRNASESGSSGASNRTRLARPPSPSASESPEAAGGAPRNDNITVDAGGNRLIFRGSASEYAQLRALLEQIDTPPRQVLVELTIAEVTLNDETRFGFDWFLRDVTGSAIVTGDTRGGLAREAGGLGVTYSRVFSRGVVEAALTAIAENRNLNILSTPRLMARSGSDAQILIGTDVPIITSQRAANIQTGGDTDVLQTVQYRQTGIILNMRPVVYGDDRIDIEIYQEVSSQEPNRTSAISSPIILNRSVTTQLSLREGTTAVIGGLIQDNYSREQRGVPFLKDVPVVGSAFRSDSVAGAKVELLILVTPYIVRNDDQMVAVATQAAGSLNRMLRLRGPRVYTLTPWRAPMQAARPHGAPQEP
jgi:general secretion pathway protein D